MTAEITELDAHEQPSDELRAKWKGYAKADQKDLIENVSRDIDDLTLAEKAAEFCLAGTIPAEQLNRSFSHLCPSDASVTVEQDAPIYYHPILPGNYTLTQQRPLAHNQHTNFTQASS